METKRYVARSIFLVLLGIALPVMPFGSSSLTVAMDVNEKRCDVADFSFSVKLSECASIKSYGSDVVTLGVRLTDMHIIKPETARDSQMVVRIRPTNSSLPRSSTQIKERQPDSTVEGRSEYKFSDLTIYHFQGMDGKPVYVSGGVMTWESNRIFGEGIEVLYQFDKARNDFEALDGRLVELLKQIGLKLELK